MGISSPSFRRCSSSRDAEAEARRRSRASLMKSPASTIILLLSVYASSAHIMPHAAVHHTRTPYSAVRAFAEADSEVAPAPPARPSGVATLTSVTELEHALEEAQECGRLCVIKFYAPYCSACLAV